MQSVVALTLALALAGAHALVSGIVPYVRNQTNSVPRDLPRALVVEPVRSCPPFPIPTPLIVVAISIAS